MSSSVNKNISSKEKRFLNCWEIRRSRSHPDRKYYFNILTGDKSWKEPTVIKQYRGTDDKQPVDKYKEKRATSGGSNAGRGSQRLLDCNLITRKGCESQRTECYKMTSDAKNYNKSIKNKYSTSDSVHLNKEITRTLSSNSSEHKYGIDYVNGSHETFDRKRRRMQSSGSVALNNDSDNEKSPSKKIKTNRSESCGSSKDNLTDLLTVTNQPKLPTIQKSKTQRRDCQNRDIPGHAIVDNKQFDDERRTDLRAHSTRKSDLAAKRLKMLKNKLAEEQVKKAKSQAEEQVKKAKSQAEEQVKKEKSLDSGKCKAAKRLETLQKKWLKEQNEVTKRVEKHYLPSLSSGKQTAKSSERGSLFKRMYSSDVHMKSDLVKDTGKVKQIGNKNLSRQHHNLTKEVPEQKESKDHNISCEELMEWEPIAEEKILSHIQEVRNQIQQDGGINSDDRGIQKSIVCGTKSIFSADGKPEWFIVLDTNILISSLAYVQTLRDTDVEGLGFPILIIPWQVLQELDILKDRGGKTKSDSVVVRVRKAVSFLHSNFTSKHPRIRGQTAIDAVAQEFKLEVPDDAILQCCLQLAQRTSQVLLLSNDKNLCNKAIVNGIKAYQISEIEQAFEEMSSESRIRIQNQSSARNGPHLSSVDVPQVTDPVSVDEEAACSDMILCKLKDLLKDLLSKVLENEMRNVYDKAWINILVFKPPWTLSMVFCCFLKHWIAVFQFVLPAEATHLLESLKGYFDDRTQNKEYGHTILEVQTILQTSIRLCSMIPQKEYSDFISTCLAALQRLQQRCEETLTTLKKGNEEHKLKSSLETQAESLNIIIRSLENYWKYVSEFCAIMCDLLGFQHNLEYNRPDPFPTVDEVRNRLPRIYPDVGILVKNISRIWELPASDMNADHEAVRNLYFTVRNLFTLEQAEERCTLEHVLLLCTTENTRSALKTAQTMFEQAEVIMGRGMNYFVQFGVP